MRKISFIFLLLLCSCNVTNNESSVSSENESITSSINTRNETSNEYAGYNKLSLIINDTISYDIYFQNEFQVLRKLDDGKKALYLNISPFDINQLENIYTDAEYTIKFEDEYINQDTTIYIKLKEEYIQYFDFSLDELKEIFDSYFKINHRDYFNESLTDYDPSGFIKDLYEDTWHHYTLDTYLGTINGYSFLVINIGNEVKSSYTDMFGITHNKMTNIYAYKDNEIFKADELIKERIQNLYDYFLRYGLDDNYYKMQEKLDDFRNEIVSRWEKTPHL